MREASRILDLRNDEVTTTLLLDLKKRDDVADTILQSIAYMVLSYVPTAGQRNRPPRKMRRKVRRAKKT